MRTLSKTDGESLPQEAVCSRATELSHFQASRSVLPRDMKSLGLCRLTVSHLLSMGNSHWRMAASTQALAEIVLQTQLLAVELGL